MLSKEHSQSMQLVRIRVPRETERVGLAGKIGEVWGWTTPLRVDYGQNVVTAITRDANALVSSQMFQCQTTRCRFPGLSMIA